MPASADYFTPPEFPEGTPSEDPNGDRPGLPVGAAFGILAGVAALGVGAVLVLGNTPDSGGTSLVAQPSISVGIPAGPSKASSSAEPSASASRSPSSHGAPESTDTSAAGGPGGGSTAYAAPTSDGTQYSVGECVDTSGSGSDFRVTDTSCPRAQYKIIYAFRDESGNVDNDVSQCYAINGNDSEFENGDPQDGYTLYCLNSLTGDYSPRRAGIDNCLDSSAAYEVDCTSSRATWIVIGRLNGTIDSTKCSQFGSYDSSYYWTAPPPFVLCVDRYKH